MVLWPAQMLVEMSKTTANWRNHSTGLIFEACLACWDWMEEVAFMLGIMPELQNLAKTRMSADVSAVYAWTCGL